jgi:hypothetical protein
VLQVPGAIAAWRAEARTPFSQARAVAQWIDAHGYRDARLVGDIDYRVSAVSAYLDRPIHYSGNHDDHTFVTWSNRRTHLPASGRGLFDDLVAIGEDARPTIIVLDRPADLRALELLATFTPAITDEEFWLYLVHYHPPS